MRARRRELDQNILIRNDWHSHISNMFLIVRHVDFDFQELILFTQVQLNLVNFLTWVNFSWRIPYASTKTDDVDNREYSTGSCCMLEVRVGWFIMKGSLSKNKVYVAESYPQ